MSEAMELTGGCACGALRYRLTGTPLVGHACHCRDCQRTTGSAFAINLWIERERVECTAGRARSFLLSGGSGKPHEVFFCEACGTTVWSRYDSVPGLSLFVRAGTLDEPGAVEPDVHIFTAAKLPWLKLPDGALVFEKMYEVRRVWPAEKYARLRANIARHAAPAGA
jgi:hypothetical protein